MVIAMCCHIVFEANSRRKAIELWRCTSATTESTWKNITDTATIELPRNIKDFDKYKVKDLFKRGDEVSISLGYNSTFTHHFKGYITSVSADIPVVIKIADEMYKIKKLPVNYSSNNCYLPDFIKQVAPSCQTDVAEYNIGSVRFAGITLGEALQKLKEEFNFYSYFQNGKLVVGKIYSDKQNTHDINLERIVNNNLEYKTADDKSIKLTATSTLVGGKKIQVELGEKDGEVRELSYFNIQSESDLKKLAQKDFDTMMSDGFEGNIEILGTKDVQHGDKINIRTDIYSDRNGQYYCDGVTTKWEKSIFHKTLEIGKKVRV